MSSCTAKRTSAGSLCKARHVSVPSDPRRYFGVLRDIIRSVASMAAWYLVRIRIVQAEEARQEELAEGRNVRHCCHIGTVSAAANGCRCRLISPTTTFPVVHHKPLLNKTLPVGVLDLSTWSQSATSSSKKPVKGADRSIACYTIPSTVCF